MSISNQHYSLLVKRQIKILNAIGLYQANVKLNITIIIVQNPFRN
ncbi:hypothetical protein [Vaginella massiliensis]|nr:hypothetical protein [Vaginella massiliensis]